MKRGLGAIPPGFVLISALVVPGVFVPLALNRWMHRNGYAVGEITILGRNGAKIVAIDPRWALPIVGIVGAIGYSLVAVLMILALRRASRITRNLALLGLVPVTVVAMWLVFTAQR
jgi:hypothetical protein